MPSLSAEEQFPAALCSRTIELPGNHYTLLTQYPQLAAAELDSWLNEVLH
jgi:hypothetical protein